MSRSSLSQKRILITRAAQQAQEMIKMLEEKGAIPISLPVIHTSMVEQREKLDKAIFEIDQFELLLFTSVNAVKYFFQRVDQLMESEAHQEEREIEQAAARSSEAFKNQIFWKHIQRIKVATIGPKTELALRHKGITPLPLPKEYRQEGLVELIQEQLPYGTRILYPRAAEVRGDLLQSLQEIGMQVQDVITYQTLPVEGQEAQLKELLQTESIDVITFTSASTVKSFMQMLDGMDARRWLSSIIIACIGPITAAKARQLGLRVEVEASTYTIEAMLESLEQYLIDREEHTDE